MIPFRSTLAFLCIGQVMVLSAQQFQPNIILILTDDQRFDAVGYAGNKIIQTPNLDSLARNGTVFSNAFCTSPISSASRASILTGMYERKHGFNFGTEPLDKTFVECSYPAILKKAGYRTGFIGKLGVSFENNAENDIFDYFKDSPMDARYYYLIEGKHIHKTDFVKEGAITFLKSCQVKQPFCLSISFNAPHAADEDPRQYIWQRQYDSMYNKIHIPPFLMSESKYFDTLPDFLRNSEGRVRWLWRFNTPEKFQGMVKGYYRMISGVDDAVGQIIQQLKKMGVYDNTIIIFSSDNGYFLGERGLADKWLMYEQSIRVPFVISDPRNKCRPIDKMVLNIDISPTIIDLAGLTLPSGINGSSIKPLLEGKLDNWRTGFLCEHLLNNPKIPKSEGIRTEEWIYFRYNDYPVDELYNLKNDPWQFENLVKKEFTIKKELISKLDKLIISAKQ